MSSDAFDNNGLTQSRTKGAIVITWGSASFWYTNGYIQKGKGPSKQQPRCGNKMVSEKCIISLIFVYFFAITIPHHGQFQATNMTSWEEELGRDAHHQLTWASRNWLQPTTSCISFCYPKSSRANAPRKMTQTFPVVHGTSFDLWHYYCLLVCISHYNERFFCC